MQAGISSIPAFFVCLFMCASLFNVILRRLMPLNRLRQFRRIHNFVAVSNAYKQKKLL